MIAMILITALVVVEKSLQSTFIFISLTIECCSLEKYIVALVRVPSMCGKCVNDDYIGHEDYNDDDYGGGARILLQYYWMHLTLGNDG